MHLWLESFGFNDVCIYGNVTSVFAQWFDWYGEGGFQWSGYVHSAMHGRSYLHYRSNQSAFNLTAGRAYML